MRRGLILAAAGALAVLFGTYGIEAGCAADAVPRRKVFSEGFEGEGQMRPWASNGPYKVNFAGPSDQKAASGKRSFKIDVAWQPECTWNYWQSAPLMIPCSGQPKISGKLYVDRGNAQFGYSWAAPEAETNGNVGVGEKVRSLPGGWSEWSCSAAGASEDGMHIEAVAVYLSPDREGRTVVYVDDLELEAAVGQDYEKETKARIDQITAKRKVQIGKAADGLRRRFQTLAGQMDVLPAELPATVSPVLAECWRQRWACSRQIRSELEPQLAQLQTTSQTSVLNAAGRLLASLEKVQASAASFVDGAKSQSALPYPVWIVEPLSDDKILPEKLPFTDRVGTELRLSACRGEYEPASFAVCAPKDKGLKGLLAESSAAKCGDFSISASAIDIRVVKCWWQAGTGISDARHPTLTPELLLKDAGLVRVDDAKKRNALRDAKAPRDAQQLLPLDVPAGSMQQFWITVHVPQDAQAGTYRGTINLRAADVPPVSLALEIEVLSFPLAEPRLQYSIYYRGCLTEDGKGSITSEGKSPAQYLAEMRDLKAHGVDKPTCYQGPGELLERSIALRREAGIAVDPFYWLGISTGAPTTPAALAALKEQTRAGVQFAAKHGIKELYVYGIDEASGDGVKAEREAFQAVHEAGAKVFVACYGDAVGLIGDLLDLAVVAYKPQPDQAEKWHAHGQRIFNYANPQVGEERPETYRLNYGLALWKAGYDGAMDYAYQHGFDDIWDDFDHRTFRDHVFAYPTVDGVIDTIEWEGFREGVDDVRYLSTLLGAIEQAKADPAKKELAAEAQKWVQGIDAGGGDLDALRKQMVRRIVQLRK